MANKYTKRADGRYQTKIYIGVENGKKKYKFLYAASIKELDKKLREQKSLYEKGVNILELEDTLGDWIAKYLPIKELNISRKEYNELKNHLDYFNDIIGDMVLKDIRQSDVQTIINKLWKCNPRTKKETSKKTLNHYLLHLGQVFEFAIEERVATYNPCKYVKLPKDAPSNPRRALTEKEINMVLEHPCDAAILGMLSGLRKGEMTALLWSDIDFKNKTISVTKSFNFFEKATKDPKTKAGTRTVYIPDVLVDYLAKMPKKSMYVLCDEDGQRLSQSKWETMWRHYLKELDSIYGIKSLQGKTNLLTITPFTIHELRHTYATMLHHADVPALDAQNALGHADIQTTIATYTHYDQIRGRNTRNKVNQYLDSSSGCQSGCQDTDKVQ